MQITCPRCGATGRLAQVVPGRRVACPRCKFAWEPVPAGAASAPSPPPPLPGYAPPPPPPLAPLPKPGVWAVGWTMAAAAALLLGVLVPYLIQVSDGGERRTRALFVWDQLGGAPFDTVLLALQPAILAILAAVAALAFHGLARGIALAAVAAAAVAVPEIVREGRWFSGAGGLGGFGGGMTAQWLCLTFGAAATAGAAHARGKAPASPIACAGLAVGSIALALGLLLPVGEGDGARSLLSLATGSEGWKNGWPVFAVILASVAFGGLGLLAAIPGANLVPVARAASILARVVALGVPASVLVVNALNRQEGADPFLVAASGIVKWSLLVEGLLAVFAVGVGQALVSLAARPVAAPARPPAPARAPSAPPPPPAPAPAPAAARSAPIPAAAPPPPWAPSPAPPPPPAAPAPAPAPVAYAPPAPPLPAPLAPAASAAVPPPPSPAAPPAREGAASQRPALEELRLRLLPLLRAREEGLLTAEEYEAKRRRIIESIDF